MSVMLERNPSIDGLRLVAVGVVIAFHINERAVPGGFIGVDVFFAISGFVITRLLLAELRESGRLDLRRFYLARFARLWPALITYCALVSAACLALGGRWLHELRFIPASLFYVRNVTQLDHQSALTGQMWSLGVEEQFYLLWPVALIAILTVRSARLRGALMSLGVAAPVVFRLFEWQGGSGYGYIRSWPIGRFDELYVGCLLALALHFGKREVVSRVASLAVAPAAALLVSGVLFIDRLAPEGNFRLAGWYWQCGILLVSLAAVSVVAVLATLPAHPLSRLLAHPVMSWPGRNLSYGMYLWHVPILIVMAENHLGALEWFEVPVLTLTVALVSHRFVEAPVRRWAAVRMVQRRSFPSDRSLVSA